LPIVGVEGESGDSIALRLKKELDDIRYGRKADPYGWNGYI